MLIKRIYCFSFFHSRRKYWEFFMKMRFFNFPRDCWNVFHKLLASTFFDVYIRPRLFRKKLVVVRSISHDVYIYHWLFVWFSVARRALNPCQLLELVIELRLKWLNYASDVTCQPLGLSKCDKICDADSYNKQTWKVLIFKPKAPSFHTIECSYINFFP